MQTGAAIRHVSMHCVRLLSAAFGLPPEAAKVGPEHQTLRSERPEAPLGLWTYVVETGPDPGSFVQTGDRRALFRDLAASGGSPNIERVIEAFKKTLARWRPT